MQKRFCDLLTAPWLVFGLTFIFPIFFAGCMAVGPDYEQPDLFPKQGWQTPLEKGLAQAPPDMEQLSRWWTVLNDPVLTDLIRNAVENNLDVRLALERIRQYRLLKGIEEANRLPTLDTSAGATWKGTSDADGTGKTGMSYSADLRAGWEMDLFGRVKRSIEAADASLSAKQEALRDTLVSLVSDLAESYIDVRTAQIQLGVVKKSLSFQTESFQLTQWQLEAGLTDELDVHQARYSLENARAQIPALEDTLNQAMNRMAVLSGQTPGALHPLLTPQAPLPELPAAIAVGLPADALRRRPDIREAEYELIAQTAKVGVATADLYPKLTLSGSIGVDALTPADLIDNALDPANWARSIAAGLTHSLFDGGSIRKNIKVQSSLQELALIQYEQAILSALEEVENTLSAYVKEQDRMTHLAAAAKEAQIAQELAQQRYQAGLVDFSTVLESQQTALSYKNTLVSSQGTCVTNLITLYKVLGGGWPCDQPVQEKSDTNQKETAGN